MKPKDILEIMGQYDAIEVSSDLRHEIGIKLDNATAKMSSREIDDLIDRYSRKASQIDSRELFTVSNISN